jgi:hypothetical protein
MNEHDRVMAVLRRQELDHVPLVVKLQLWYNARLATGTMPERFCGWSMLDIGRELGIGIRYLKPVYDLRSDGFEKRETTSGDETTVEYVTPVGSVTTKTVYNDIMRRSGVTSSYRTEHQIKRLEDYDVMEYIFEHTHAVPCYEIFAQADKEVGGDGFVLGGPIECPYQRWLIGLTGYETAFSHLADYPERVERFFRFLTDWTCNVYQLMMDSPAQVILSGDNFDGTITPPRLFRKYCVPFFQEFTAQLHRRGKLLASHIDGDAFPLLEAFPESGVDIAECFTPAPMTRASLAEAQRLWKDRLLIWGGIPSVILCPSTPDDVFEQFLDDLFGKVVPAGGIILGVGDNVVGDAMLARLIRISQMAREGR